MVQILLKYVQNLHKSGIISQLAHSGGANFSGEWDFAQISENT